MVGFLNGRILCTEFVPCKVLSLQTKVPLGKCSEGLNEFNNFKEPNTLVLSLLKGRGFRPKLAPCEMLRL